MCTRSDRGTAVESSDGFTLVEMLVALVLVGLMSLLVFDIHGRLAHVRSLQQQYQLESDVSAVARHLATELDHALARPFLGDTGDEMHYLRGASDVLRFVAVVRTGFDREELRDVTFRWNGLDGELWRSTTLRRGAMETRKSSEQSEKLDVAIEAVSFSYLTQSGEWQDNWPHSRLLPKSVRVAIEGRGPRNTFAVRAIADLR